LNAIILFFDITAVGCPGGLCSLIDIPSPIASFPLAISTKADMFFTGVHVHVIPFRYLSTAQKYPLKFTFFQAHLSVYGISLEACVFDMDIFAMFIFVEFAYVVRGNGEAEQIKICITNKPL
jgi:hypothetical protein